jgi:anaerobic ribonucleoside-triphosphate reductase activating protein
MSNIIRCIYPFTESFLDYPDNESNCISIYILGCEHNCKDCSNPNFQNINYESKDVLKIDVNNFFQLLKNFTEKRYTKKITLLGGDPLFSTNLIFTKELLIKNIFYDICIYTGYEIDYLKKHNIKGFSYVKCGRYDISLQQKSFKNDNMIQFASKNQKLYDKDFNLLSYDGIYKF